MGGSLSFSTPVGAMRAYSEQMDTHAKNMASTGAVAGTPFTTYVQAFQTNQSQGVVTHTVRHIDQVGLPITSATAENFTIDGQGLALVRNLPDGTTDGKGTLGFTRDGTFRIDGNKNLVNMSGQYLLISRTDENGVPLNPNVSSAEGLETMNVGNLVQNAIATTKISFQTQLRANAPIGDIFPQPISIRNSLGLAENLECTWKKVDLPTSPVAGTAQCWELKISGANIGTINSPYNTGMLVSFDEEGMPIDFGGSDTPPDIAIEWDEGNAADSIFKLNLGDKGKNNGVVVAGNESIIKGVSVNGAASGTFKRLSIDKDGFVMVTFSNDQVVKYGRIPLALFNNINGLEEREPGVFVVSSDSGNYMICFPGSRNAGTLVSSSYEGSSVDGTEIYVDLIETEKNLFGNFKVVEVFKEVYKKLENI